MPGRCRRPTTTGASTLRASSVTPLRPSRYAETSRSSTRKASPASFSFARCAQAGFRWSRCGAVPSPCGVSSPPVTRSSAMARVAVVVPDLLFGSRVQGGVQAAGHELVAAEADPDLVIADVEVVDPAGVAGPRRLGFYPHVQPELKKRAEDAGFDMVVPRSRIARELPDLVERLLAR